MAKKTGGGGGGIQVSLLQQQKEEGGGVVGTGRHYKFYPFSRGEGTKTTLTGDFSIL